jgi:hypothetical protein
VDAWLGQQRLRVMA